MSSDEQLPEMLTTPHRHLGHRLALSDYETLGSISDEISLAAGKGDDEDGALLFIGCWCLECNAPVNLVAKVIDEQLAISVDRLGL